MRPVLVRGGSGSIEIMLALDLCSGCQRHVRVTDSRCPFCGHDRTEALDALHAAHGHAPVRVDVAPRALPRAMLVSLGASLALGACQPRGPSHTPLTVSPPEASAHPVIAAPYGAPPPPPPEDGAAPAPPRREPGWLVTLPDPIRMSARSSTPLEISATNLYDTALDPRRDALELRVNGVVSPVFSLAFGNGVRGPEWQRIPAHSVARDSRMILEALMPTPGEYMLELYLDGRRVAARRVQVTP